MATATTIDEYVAALPEPLRAISEKLRPVIEGAVPGSAVDSVYHQAPTWSVGPARGDGLVCYLKAYTSYVTFGFWHGQQIDDPSGRLQKGAREMAQVKLRSIEDIDSDLFAGWVRRAWDIEKALLES
jgi:hypothetical protein